MVQLLVEGMYSEYEASQNHHKAPKEKGWEGDDKGHAGRVQWKVNGKLLRAVVETVQNTFVCKWADINEREIIEKIEKVGKKAETWEG